MPLVGGSDKKAISSNIATEIRSGRKPDQAKAIAYSEARRSAKRSKRPARVRALMKSTGKGAY